MKKIFLIIVGLLICAQSVWGDAVDDGLPDPVTEQIRNQTRAMINAGIPEDAAIKMTRAMVQNKFQEKTIQKAQQVVMDTVDRDLPAEPVMNKAHEGMAKNIPQERIVQAMAKLTGRRDINTGVGWWGIADWIHRRETP